MKETRKSGRYLVIGIRWSARILSGVLAGVVLFGVGRHAFGDGDLPNPFTQSPSVAFEVMGLFVSWIGLIVAWKWEAIGAALIIIGMLVFHIIEGKLWLGQIYIVFEVAGILYLLSWQLRRVCSRKWGQAELSAGTQG